MRGDSGFPFNVREAVHFFTQNEVSELLGQFTAAKGISLEADVAADIYELTAGHAGLVCACGRALESAPGLRQCGQVKLARWRDFRKQHFIDSVLEWPTIGGMVRSVSRMIPAARLLLEQALLAGNAPLVLKTALPSVSDAARYLAAEGWLVPAGAIGAECFRITSPLVRSLAMHQLAKKRGYELTASLPFLVGIEHQLDVPALLAAALPRFRSSTMRGVSAVSSKTSSALASLFELPIGRKVPKEAVYHFELFAVLRQWLGFWKHAELYPEADVLSAVREQGADATEVVPKLYADMLIGPSSFSCLNHVLELVASSAPAGIHQHYSRTIECMASHETNRGACVVFTAVASSSAASTPLAGLTWPTALQLGSGLVAVHVVHDLNWTTAVVHWMSAAGNGTFAVGLATKR